MEIHLKIVGVLLILLAVMHIGLPGYFNWRNELKEVTLVTRQILYVHTFFIALIVLLMGVICLLESSDLIHTVLGNKISLLLFVFWLIRLMFQFFVYSPKLWRGKPFETVMHILFSTLWIYFTIVFFLVYTNFQP